MSGEDAVLVRKWEKGYVITRITGPSHNFLRLVVSQNPVVAAFDLKAWEREGEQAQLQPAEVKQWIERGIDRANHELGTDYAPRYAEIDVTDTYNPDIYSEMARRIVLQAHEDSLAR